MAVISTIRFTTTVRTILKQACSHCWLNMRFPSTAPEPEGLIPGADDHDNVRYYQGRSRNLCDWNRIIDDVRTLENVEFEIVAHDCH